MVTHSEGPTARDAQIAKLFRTLGNAPLSLSQAKTAAQLLGISRSSVYRLRRRYLANPVASSVRPKPPGPALGARLLPARAERIVDAVLTHWLPRQRSLAHPMRDVTMEVRRRCAHAGVKPVSRATVARRWKELREQQALVLASDPTSAIPPGHLIASKEGVPHTRAGPFRCVRLHRVLLQPDAPAFDARLSQSRTVRESSRSLGRCQRDRQPHPSR